MLQHCRSVLGLVLTARPLWLAITGGTAQEKTGARKVIGFKKVVIAAGSQAVRLPFMPNDPRVVDSTGPLALKEVPKRMLILGGGMVGVHAGDMIGEIVLAIEMGADAIDIGETIHPLPTLGECIGMAAEVAHGSCTDVPPARK